MTPASVMHRVESYRDRAATHRHAARNWEAIAGEKPEHRAYYLTLAETQRTLMRACVEAAVLLEIATLALGAAS